MSCWVDILTTRTVKSTRKIHYCEWCGEEITKGRSCIYRSYVFSGDFNSGHMHLECYDAMNKTDWNTWYWDDGFYPGDMLRGKTGEETMKIRGEI
jgi:hypothetical protein